MNDEELCYAQASELVALYRRRKVSPMEVVRAVLGRIEKVNPTAQCVLHGGGGAGGGSGAAGDGGAR